MIKSTKSLLLLILFLTLPISSMHQFTFPSLNLNDHDKKSSLILFCCAITAIGLSYLGYKYIKPTKKAINNPILTIPKTNIPDINSTEIVQSIKSNPNNDQLWIETNDHITLSISTKHYLPKCGLRYLLEKYKQYFGHYNDAETPLKIGRSLYDLKLLQRASSYLKSNMTQFNFNNAQQTILLEMASAFKIHKLYLALLNCNLIPNDINIKQITPYCIA
jgi:hypothetical protein